MSEPDASDIRPFAADDPRGLRIAGDRIGRQLQAVIILARQAEKRLGEALGINLTDLAAMEQLITHGPLAPTDLAVRLKLTTAGSTLVIDRLERAGHVVRARQADDRRRVLVTPVRSSVAQAFRHLAPMLNGLDAVVRVLDDSDRDVIERFLDQVITTYRATTCPHDDRS